MIVQIVPKAANLDQGHIILIFRESQAVGAILDKSKMAAIQSRVMS